MEHARVSLLDLSRIGKQNPLHMSLYGISKSPYTCIGTALPLGTVHKMDMCMSRKVYFKWRKNIRLVQKTCAAIAWWRFHAAHTRTRAVLWKEESDDEVSVSINVYNRSWQITFPPWIEVGFNLMMCMVSLLLHGFAPCRQDDKSRSAIYQQCFSKPRTTVHPEKCHQ